ncbi:MAG: chemotaxis protein CheA, partial [Pseudomonadales bacterium]|nr:chemotaxis protein CheA [Pseudomonadales bacterium]
IKLVVEGETTELDKIVMEKIGDPLVHLVRNSIDHGIEIPEVRKAAGKAEVGILKLVAYQEARNIVIQVIDDGAGLNKKRILEKAIENGLVSQDDHLSDEQINHLIFAPGFSTADVVSDISGRGVGMDVVKRNIQDIGGRVEVISEEGKGSIFTIRLPLTLAILDGQLVKSGKEIYVIPVLTIIESVLVDLKNFSLIANDQLVYHFRDEYISISDLGKYGSFNGRCMVKDLSLLESHIIVVCECDGRKFGIIVDELSDQQQVVIKSLDVNYKEIRGLSGGTILGDGRVALILDPIELMNSCMEDVGGDNKLLESA